MGLVFEYSEGQTPLDEDEADGLRIRTIATQGELNEFEQQNIEEAVLWTIGRNLNAKDILSEKFVKELHRRMYGKVWKWAGAFRQTNKNIGVDKWQISIELRALLEDILYWIENDTYQADEMAIRFKHRLVSIHCFSNGNGRHSRLMADIIIEKIFKQPVFSWGTANLSVTNDVRSVYLKAVKEADKGNYLALQAFARS